MRAGAQGGRNFPPPAPVLVSAAPSAHRCGHLLAGYPRGKHPSCSSWGGPRAESWMELPDLATLMRGWCQCSWARSQQMHQLLAAGVSTGCLFGWRWKPSHAQSTLSTPSWLTYWFPSLLPTSPSIRMRLFTHTEAGQAPEALPRCQGAEHAAALGAPGAPL